MQSGKNWNLADLVSNLFRRDAFVTDDVCRRQELIDDMWFFADQAMTALITQFPGEEHVFPVPLPDLNGGPRM